MYPPGSKLRFQKSFLAGRPSVEFDSETSARWAKDAMHFERPDLGVLNGRYLNTFCVGSDPEFCFSRGTRKAIAAEHGLKPALAFGSDQNSRLVELRPAPSRSVVEHIASLLVTLRWMVRLHPDTLQFGWRCGAFFDGDGMGGHVHFGRKRPSRTEEVAALDGLARTFRSAGFFPETEWNRRVQGDGHGQIYGAYSDYRVQAHGYEYRTLPSWLRSPLLAFVIVAASKLAVLDPVVTTEWGVCDRATAVSRLTALAKLYAGRDDDARILYRLLLDKADVLVHQTGCFRKAWGLPDAQVDDNGNYIVKGMQKPKWDFIPSMIWPTPEESAELLNHLVSGDSLVFPKAEAGFNTKLPKGFRWLYNTCGTTTRYPGVGDFFHDLVTNDVYPIAIGVTDHCSASAALYNYEPLRKALPEMRLLSEKTPTVTLFLSRQIVRDLPRARALKRFLLSGAFPLWTVETASPEALAKFVPIPLPKPERKKNTISVPGKPTLL